MQNILLAKRGSCEATVFCLVLDVPNGKGVAIPRACAAATIAIKAQVHNRQMVRPVWRRTDQDWHIWLESLDAGRFCFVKLQLSGSSSSGKCQAVTPLASHMHQV